MVNIMTKKRSIFNAETTTHHGALTPSLPMPWEQQQERSPTLPPAFYGWRDTPTGRVDTITGAVVIPFLQGLVQGVGPFMLMTVIASVVTVLAQGPWWLPPALGLFVLAAIVSWRVWLFVDNRQEQLWQREEIERRDLDGDGHIGKPDDNGAALTLNIQYQDADGFNRLRRLELPRWVDLQALHLFARAALNGLPTSEAEWTPASKGFSVHRFRQLMELLEGAEPPIMEKENPEVSNSPRRLTDYGRALFEEFTQTSPLLLGRDSTSRTP